ncbi:FK506-binding protein 1 [Kwoniella mangroviensis CBS 8886]|nr:FK506-binding protein 1 [Kwoniella mangroviensis CBS 8886]
MGITIETITPGDGKTFAQLGHQVTMHYVGTLANGKVFDSSRDKGPPFTCVIGVGQVIKGWDEGIPRLSLGSKAMLTCPPEYAYGLRGMGGIIPPNATLKFEVEILNIQPHSHHDQKSKPQQAQQAPPAHPVKVPSQPEPKHQGKASQVLKKIGKQHKD